MSAVATIIFLLEDADNTTVVTNPAPTELPKEGTGLVKDKNANYYFDGLPSHALRRACSSDHEDLYDEPTPAVTADAQGSGAEGPMPIEPIVAPEDKKASNHNNAKKGTSKKAKSEHKLSNKERKLQKKRDKEKASQILAEYDNVPSKTEDGVVVPDKVLGSLSI